MLVNSLLFGVLWYQIIAHVGISAGLHRYWAHRAFVAGTLFEILTLYMFTDVFPIQALLKPIENRTCLCRVF